MTRRPTHSEESETLPNLEVCLLGRRITCMTAPAIIKAIHKACVENKQFTVAHYNVHGFNLSMQLPWFYNFLQSVDIVHCDSIGILKALRYMGLNLPIQYRVSYSILLPQLLELCNRNHFSLYLLGSHPDHLTQALQRVQELYPNIRLSGHDGYFKPQDAAANDAVIAHINQFQPQVLLVGMGMPRQENWVRLNRHRLDANTILTCGAAIDRMAGVVPDCPKVLSNVGLEWMYRLWREPKRLAARYLLGNPAFLLQIMLAKFQVRPAELINVASDIQPELQSSQFSYTR